MHKVKFTKTFIKSFKKIKRSDQGRIIVEDFLDHLHAESVLQNTNKNDWIDLKTVKEELGIK